jgi:rod shape determining protein RodA
VTTVDRVRSTRFPPRALAALRGRQAAWRSIDWLLVGCALALSLIGSVLIWSATRPRLLQAGGNQLAFFERHLMNLAIGLVLGAVAAWMNYRNLRASAPVVYAASCLGLVAVLVVGSTINGSHSWIVLGGGFQVQPSEFAKVALVVTMAMIFAERRERDDGRQRYTVPLVLGLAAVPVGLIMLQPDVGTIMVLTFTIFVVLALAEVDWRWMVALALFGVIVSVGAAKFGVLKDYQLDRFRAFTNPQAHTQGAAYNVTQARIAIGNGGLTGTGLFKGSQTNGRFVPEQQTDFVFTVAGEELGFLGAGGIVVLFGIMLWRALRIAGRAPDEFGRLVAVGVTAWFAFQTFVNIGMTLGITPVTGLPLPFVSYGGSSMFANCIAIGLLLNVHRRTRAQPAQL